MGRNLATLLDEPIFSVRKALADLRRLGLAERERHVRGPPLFDSYTRKEGSRNTASTSGRILQERISRGIN